MKHSNKILALLRAELKNLQGEVYDEGEAHDDESLGIVEGLEIAINIVENYIERND